ncbi:MAG TPA: cell division protein ZipA C-terminal FtsZ-binding domain-containing protein [Burkholderiales bacterium]|nr:cell division protein ZipA C-terminal FtsZ-binding domain-containing protein [Burkholderiales bacterium]
MTDLTLGLVVVGALAVAVVLLYNRWQERSARRDAERPFASAPPDVLLADPQGRQEPRLDTVRRVPDPPRGASPDPRVDYVIDLALPEAGDAQLAEGWRTITQRFARRALLSGAAGRWQAGLQLVSRAGVVGEPELVEFRSAVETLTARLGGSAAAPEMREALHAARELDRACAEADIQVALHVVGVPSAPRFDGQPFQAAARADGVTLTLDVPRTAEPSRSYEAMARAGRELAAKHGGRLVDDEGRELDERALAAIGVQLEVVRRLLAGRGLEPGSPLALRVFS